MRKNMEMYMFDEPYPDGGVEVAATHIGEALTYLCAFPFVDVNNLIFTGTRKF